jgi:hypothetical protein
LSCVKFRAPSKCLGENFHDQIFPRRDLFSVGPDIRFAGIWSAKERPNAFKSVGSATTSATFQDDPKKAAAPPPASSQACLETIRICADMNAKRGTWRLPVLLLLLLPSGRCYHATSGTHRVRGVM